MSSLNLSNLLSFYQGKTVFITGHTGFKGAWLCQILLNAGAKVVGYALEPPTTPSLFDILDLQSSVDSHIGDIRDLEHLSAVMQQANPEIIFHLAAQPLVLDSYKQPVLTYETNVMGTVNLLEAARSVQTLRSLVNVTTDKVYENREWAKGYVETDTLGGFDPYANSKACSELVTSSYRSAFYDADDAPAISTARAGNVIGGGDYSDNRIIPDCVRAVQVNAPLIIRNPGSTRPYQHVMECLSGYLTLAALQYEDESFSGSYNIGPEPNSNVTTEQLVQAFNKAWLQYDTNFAYEIKPSDGPHEAGFLQLDISLAKQRLNWHPQWNIEQAVAQTVAWYHTWLTRGDVVAEINRQISQYFAASLV